MQYNTLQQTATDWIRLQQTATRCRLNHMTWLTLDTATLCNAIQHTATDCNTQRCSPGNLMWPVYNDFSTGAKSDSGNVCPPARRYWPREWRCTYYLTKSRVEIGYENDDDKNDESRVKIGYKNDNWLQECWYTYYRTKSRVKSSGFKV